MLGFGVSERTISRRIAKRDLIAVHLGVYGLGHAERTPVALAHAAVLACGPDAVLSHDSAAALWGLRRYWPPRPEVTAAVTRTRPGIVTHRSRTLIAGDITVNYGLCVTTIVRTIIDISPRLTDSELTRAINDARLAHQLKATGLNELLERSSRARRLIDPTQNATRSPLEDAFLRWIRRHRLPMPTINRRSGGREVDAVFEAERVIVELDSWTYHGDQTSFRADRARDRRNAADGYLPLRYTRHDLTDAEAHRLRHILDARRQS